MIIDKADNIFVQREAIKILQKEFFSLKSKLIESYAIKTFIYQPVAVAIWKF